MATYKVIQDIEAEDKFLGPLTLKQFIFGAGGLFFGYLSVLMLRDFPYGLALTVPPMLLGIFLAVPWSKDQPTEVWVLAKLRFYFKPRKKIWDQSGMEELVTITAPKKEEKHLTDNLSQIEVKSRLRALADTIDSRGWAIKELGNGSGLRPLGETDRLISPSTLPKEVPIMDTSTIPDVYVEKTATSENFDRMMEQSTSIIKAQNLEKMDRIRHGEPLESIVLPEVHFTPQPTPNTPAYPALNPIDEESLTKELKSRREPDSIATAHMRTISPLGSNSATAQTDDSNQAKQSDDEDAENQDNFIENNVEESVPAHPSTAILEYAGNNDLNIATIARQAKKDVEGDANEVVISLR